ncbi:hypothetical protein CERSUDRAFT_111708 [Gelatoporia subvermispora B]|uniref:SH3 domain-containing protein n=1 Tax=Ceriporiopsis subvermispora (strain B) TaxID=914234 RepID=M2QVK4_CERS8|nr:hypothetical protein CERSUDRAFT_111708 [Gelatoporia subvermispora B]
MNGMASAAVPDPAPAGTRLSLDVDHPASCSPFPSPGSPFFPPPLLGAHEFALRPSPAQAMRSAAAAAGPSARRLGDTLKEPDASTGETTPTLAQHTLAASPATPTPHAAFPPTPQISIPDPEDATNFAPQPSPKLEPAAPPTPASQRSSLYSSRPAPPSPALSRRSSAARSRRASRVAHEAEPSSSSTATVTVQEGAAAEPEKKQRRSLLMKIRDFAYPASDARHTGHGGDAPRANRPRRKRASTASSTSSTSSTSSAGEDEDEGGPGGWGQFQWNTLSAQFKWDRESASTGEGPSQGDLARNFGGDAYDSLSDDDEYDEPEGEGNEGAEGPLEPGMYRALYAFEPEGTAEMALVEDQVVRVVGRGGGVGWAVVEREEGGHALVPESYLERVSTEA